MPLQDYEFKYELHEAPGARLDGSKQVGHDLYLVHRAAGSNDGWTRSGGHDTVLVPADDLQAILDAPGNNAQKAGAYKDLLNLHLFSPATPNPPAWDIDEQVLHLDNNKRSVEVATNAGEWIDTLGLEYPIRFAL